MKLRSDLILGTVLGLLACGGGKEVASPVTGMATVRILNEYGDWIRVFVRPSPAGAEYLVTDVSWDSGTLCLIYALATPSVFIEVSDPARYTADQTTWLPAQRRYQNLNISRGSQSSGNLGSVSVPIINEPPEGTPLPEPCQP